VEYCDFYLPDETAAGGRDPAGNAMGAAGLMGLGAAGMFAGVDSRTLFRAVPAADAWTCACGRAAKAGSFCVECGSPRPASPPLVETWACACGRVNDGGKFCADCGKRKE